ncbi:MAG: hypothetical protein ACE5KH_05045, partial [Candidatus Geothermarchaeales archaeon]
SEELTRLEESLTRITTRFAVQVLDSADFHHMDEEVSGGNLDPKFIPVIRSSIAVADPTFFPKRIGRLVVSLRENLGELEAAIRDRDLDNAKTFSHEVHGLEHHLHHEAHEWLS